MDTFILNLVHRPELVPEYINTDALKSFGATQRRIPFGSGV